MLQLCLFNQISQLHLLHIQRSSELVVSPAPEKWHPFEQWNAF